MKPCLLIQVCSCFFLANVFCANISLEEIVTTFMETGRGVFYEKFDYKDGVLIPVVSERSAISEDEIKKEKKIKKFICQYEEYSSYNAFFEGLTEKQKLFLQGNKWWLEGLVHFIRPHNGIIRIIERLEGRRAGAGEDNIPKVYVDIRTCSDRLALTEYHDVDWSSSTWENRVSVLNETKKQLGMIMNKSRTYSCMNIFFSFLELVRKGKDDG